MEKWKTVDGTCGMIEVSSDGRVRSLLRGEPHILKTCPVKKGYQRLRVTINREKMSFKLHRLVAIAFIPNPGNLPQVNHIDGNKANNAVSNLEWVSNAENAQHAIKTGLWDSVMKGTREENNKRKTPIIACKDDEEIIFESIASAERYFQSRHIADALHGKRKHVKGWTFRHESEVMPNGN